MGGNEVAQARHNGSYQMQGGFRLKECTIQVRHTFAKNINRYRGDWGGTASHL